MDSGLNAVFLKAFQYLQMSGQFFGCGSFTYTPGIGAQVKPINIFSFIVFIILCLLLAYINTVNDFTINAEGYAAILFHIGMESASQQAMLLNSFFPAIMFIARKKIASLLDDILAFDSEV